MRQIRHFVDNRGMHTDDKLKQVEDLKIEECVKWAKALLSNGPVTTSLFNDEAYKRRYYSSVVAHSKKILGVQRFYDKPSDQFYLCLSNQTTILHRTAEDFERINKREAAMRLAAEKRRATKQAAIQNKQIEKEKEYKPTDEEVASFAQFFGYKMEEDDEPAPEPIPKESADDAQQIHSHDLLKALPDESVKVAVLGPSLFPLSHDHLKNLLRILKRNGTVKIN